ncbi:MAG: hypothetical protein RL228_1116 [Actinomycetota bacterium]|jgi:hypothetical protein
MNETRETELLARISILENKIDELMVQNKLLKSRQNSRVLKIDTRSAPDLNSQYLTNFIAASWFPIFSGACRWVYKRIYRLK